MTSPYLKAGIIPVFDSDKRNSMSAWLEEVPLVPGAGSHSGFRSLSKILFADLKPAQIGPNTACNKQAFGRVVIAPPGACYEKELEVKGSPFAVVNYILSESSASSRWLRATGFIDQGFENGHLDMRFHPDGAVVAVLTFPDGRKRTVVCRQDGCYFQRLTNATGEELVRFSSRNPQPTSSSMLNHRRSGEHG